MTTKTIKQALVSASVYKTVASISHKVVHHSVRGDRVFRFVLRALALGVLAIAFLMIAQLLRSGWPALQHFGLGFFTSSDWNQTSQQFGAAPFVVGTLLTSFLALVIAIPFAISSAIFVTEYAPSWLARPVGYLIELLAAIPSVVYGLWGIFVLVPIIQQIQLSILTNPSLNQISWLASAPSGRGLLTAVIVLAIMVIPFAASVARDVIKLVPKDQKEAAYALGATKWEVIRQAVLPYARAGIFGGVILALGRALGETMAVTMLIGNDNKFPSSLFGSAATMSSLIANEFAEARPGLHIASLMAVGFLLFVISLIVNALARVLIARLTPKTF